VNPKWDGRFNGRVRLVVRVKARGGGVGGWGGIGRFAAVRARGVVDVWVRALTSTTPRGF